MWLMTVEIRMGIGSIRDHGHIAMKQNKDTSVQLQRKEHPISVGAIPIERFLFGNEHWRSNRAINEIEVYCDLLDGLQERIDGLQTRGKDEEVTLTNVKAVTSSYAFEIGVKSLWALDHPTDSVPTIHDLLELYDGLSGETVDSLNRLHMTKEAFVNWPKPFISNRYSMESGDRGISVYQTEFLRSLAQLLKDKLEETRKTVFTRPGWPGA